MEMQSQQLIPASRETVWRALNDTGVLEASMPGCERFEETGENEYLALVTARVGPVKAKFKFNVQLTEIDPPNGYVIQGEGQGGAAGFAKGSARVSLSDEGEQTLLSYTVKASVGGKLAQLGGRLIDGTAKKMADEFFSNFIAEVAGDEAEKPAPASSGGEEAGRRTIPWIWLAGGLVLIAAF
ncbi:MAG: carbon monoxide dehydrogenase subunit G, partial [Pseudohongiellaceae bacterium]